jgi:hypothetical protein
LELALLNLELGIDAMTEHALSSGRHDFAIAIEMKVAGARVGGRSGLPFDNEHSVALEREVERIGGSDNRPLRKVRADGGQLDARAGRLRRKLWPACLKSGGARIGQVVARHVEYERTGAHAGKGRM